MGYTPDNEPHHSGGPKPNWPRIGKIAEEFLGAALVAVVLGLVGAWYSVRDSVAHNRDVITNHKYEIKTLREFQEKGARFTQGDSKQLLEDIDAIEDKVNLRVAELEQRCSSIGVEIARLPPPQWQARILDLERELSIVKGKLEAKSNPGRRR